MNIVSPLTSCCLPVFIYWHIVDGPCTFNLHFFVLASCIVRIIRLVHVMIGILSWGCNCPLLFVIDVPFVCLAVALSCIICHRLNFCFVVEKWIACVCYHCEEAIEISHIALLFLLLHILILTVISLIKLIPMRLQFLSGVGVESQPSSGAGLRCSVPQVRHAMNVMLFSFSLSLSLSLFSVSLRHCDVSVSLWLSAPGETGDCCFFYIYPSIWAGISRQNDDTYLHGNTALSILHTTPPPTLSPLSKSCPRPQKIENPWISRPLAVSPLHVGSAYRQFTFQPQHEHRHTLVLLNKLCSAAGLLCPVGQCVEQRDINHSEGMRLSKHWLAVSTVCVLIQYVFYFFSSLHSVCWSGCVWFAGRMFAYVQYTCKRWCDTASNCRFSPLCFF